MADVIETDYTTEPPTITERDFNAAEKAQRAADIKTYKAAEKAALEAIKAREAALDKLLSLGLTMDDLSALGIS